MGAGETGNAEEDRLEAWTWMVEDPEHLPRVFLKRREQSTCIQCCLGVQLRKYKKTSRLPIRGFLMITANMC